MIHRAIFSPTGIRFKASEDLVIEVAPPCFPYFHPAM